MPPALAIATLRRDGVKRGAPGGGVGEPLESRRRAVGEPLESRWRAVGEPLDRHLVVVVDGHVAQHGEGPAHGVLVAQLRGSAREPLESRCREHGEGPAHGVLVAQRCASRERAFKRAFGGEGRVLVARRRGPVAMSARVSVR
jgi:hypothetical protein